jgi:adenosylcobinamide-GDP ribazoletransferase
VGFRKLIAAIAFYTCIPIPTSATLDFQGIARLAPLVGLLIGAILGIVDLGLQLLGMSIWVRSGLIVALWLGLTGGLHLDGAIDTADGLAVTNPQRRLDVMAESTTGAFGAMTAVIILLLKTIALAEILDHRSIALMLAAGWGRWGQLIAIALYPYLKPTGKGAFHKQAIRSPWAALPSFLLLLSLTGLGTLYLDIPAFTSIGLAIAGCSIALSVGAWLNYQLGGHTGDTYGAIVEWTEALLLCLFSLV